jgi:hypothetical protein
MKKDEIKKALEEVRKASRHGDTPEWRAAYEKYSTPAVLILPLGELTNPSITGMVVAWRMTGKLEHIDWRDQDAKSRGIAADALEGLCQIKTTLLTALLAADVLPDFRWSIET